jgi:hypothetical protein
LAINRPWGGFPKGFPGAKPRSTIERPGKPGAAWGYAAVLKVLRISATTSPSMADSRAEELLVE